VAGDGDLDAIEPAIDATTGGEPSGQDVASDDDLDAIERTIDATTGGEP
jgi:hypothetical protein